MAYTHWSDIQSELKSQLPRHTFHSFVEPADCTNYDGDELLLSFTDGFSKENFEEKCLPALKEILRKTVNPNCRVALSIAEREEAPTAIKTSFAVPSQYEHPRFDPKYRFENFVVGGSNQFAHAACEAVSKQPGRCYNPLFIFGRAGLGKTHLLKAIGNEACSHDRKLKVIYATTETFTNELIQSIRTDKMREFREKYRSGCDVLLIDDVHFLAGKDRTQEEFFYTFNYLHELRKQIVVTSDRYPKDIQGLEARLQTRFEWGLVADVQPPEIETRVAILKNKAEESSIPLPDEVAEYIASHVKHNIRELEGAKASRVIQANRARPRGDGNIPQPCAGADVAEYHIAVGSARWGGVDCQTFHAGGGRIDGRVRGGGEQHIPRVRVVAGFGVEHHGAREPYGVGVLQIDIPAIGGEIGIQHCRAAVQTDTPGRRNHQSGIDLHRAKRIRGERNASAARRGDGCGDRQISARGLQRHRIVGRRHGVDRPIDGQPARGIPDGQRPATGNGFDGVDFVCGGIQRDRRDGCGVGANRQTVHVERRARGLCDRPRDVAAYTENQPARGRGDVPQRHIRGVLDRDGGGRVVGRLERGSRFKLDAPTIAINRDRTGGGSVPDARGTLNQDCQTSRPRSRGSGEDYISRTGRTKASR